MTAPRVAITGGYGFLGWHLACRLRALTGVDAVRLGRADFADPVGLAARLADIDLVYHVAGVNRAESEEAVEAGNVALAKSLATALRDRPVHIVYANSIQCEADNPYGRGKREAARILAKLPGTMADVVLPNLFGEHGRPAYNSFVATFCDAIASGRAPTVTSDRAVPLLHAQRAAQALIDAAATRENAHVLPEGEPKLVSEVLAMLEGFHQTYGRGGEFPDLSSNFATDLFNTYRSYLFPDNLPFFPQGHADSRGLLFEAVRSHGGQGQSYVSTTVPGATRGEHYHLNKVERFFVVKGEAEVQLRRLLSDEVVTFRVSGERPAIIDMPTLWVHNIKNVGHSEVITMFWSDQLLDPQNPDQYPERVAAP